MHIKYILYGRAGVAELADARDLKSLGARATYGKMAQNLGWATGSNAIALPLAAGILYSLGILLNPAIGIIFMSLSTTVVAINARFLRIEK